MFTIPTGATQHVIAQLQEQYTNDLHQFRETNNVKKTVGQQIVASIDPKFLKTLHSSITNKITASLPNIIQHLLDTYNDVTPSELDQLHQKIGDIHFNPMEPVDTIFTKIEDFSDV
eukprot:4040511-Ditylum_brightwellii.AAC.1